MEKPWDKLRRKSLPPLEPGLWSVSDDTLVHDAWESPLIGLDSFGTICGTPAARLSFGTGTPQSHAFTAKALRYLAEFCTELADQLESQ